MKTDVNRDASRAMNFLHLARLVINKHITPRVFGLTCAHMFDHDLTVDQRATVLSELLDAVIRQHNVFTKEFGPYAEHSSWMHDQHFATVRDICTVAFATTPDGEGQQAIVMQMVNELGQVTADIPMWITGGLIVVHMPFRRTDFTNEEQAMIIDETLRDCLAAYQDTLTKVKHMREGEDW
jgi:hypothetical protein